MQWGLYWMERSPEEKREFIELFANHVKGTYMRRTGPRFGKEIISLNEEQSNDNYAIVQVGLIKRTRRKSISGFSFNQKKWRMADL